MAQKGAGQRKTVPAYSADTMALRLVCGLALIALGTVIFLAVDLHMSGGVFDSLRALCFGLTGGLSYVLAALPVWAGVLTVVSTQRKAPVRPWAFAFLAFIGAAAFLVLTATNGRYLENVSAGQKDWGAAIRKVYEDGRNERLSGGALGAVFGWPLWRFTGTILGSAIDVILTLLCALTAANLTPGRIRDLLTGKAARERNERAEQSGQQIAWQQQQAMLAEQERQRQIAWQQQQMQQMGQAAPMNAGYAQRTYAEAPGYAQGQTGQYPQGQYPQGQPAARPYAPPEDRGVADWQQQTMIGQAAGNGKPHESRLFGRKETEEAETGEKQSFVSRIFGRKGEQPDGLSDGTADSGRPPRAAEQRSAGRETARRTATGSEITRPATRWTAPEAPKSAEEERPAARPEPAERPAQRPAERPEERPRPVERHAERPIERPAQRPAEIPAEKTVERPAESPARRTEQLTIPKIQQEIGTKTWKPELKGPAGERRQEEEEDAGWTPTVYNYPPVTDLAVKPANTEDTAAEDEYRSRKLEETLLSFRVQARVVHVTHGPAVSRFELELAAGTKVGKVAELEKDIAYGMEATSVRIEAPIPGKSLVGVEVPNRKVSVVTLREVLLDEKMQNARSILTVALGKDIAGAPIVCDLARMPHLLIAGATGSGKSVCINAIINSLLFRAGPDEVRMILIDPKVVELQCYEHIPHLLIPVVNDPHKAAAALAWAVAEMMERYDQFAARRVRNLDGYNAALAEGERPMPRIVIIIDELADLMMVCKKDVEEYICRLTQLARAAGIHLIVATQRPSVDVITGLIKANIPSRIAFKTASYVDSRTILDRNGAEQLLGYGDMLYLPTGSFTPTRVQGCYLTDDEVNRVAKHVRENNPSTYDPDILDKLEKISSGGAELPGADIIGGSPESGGDGDLFEQAVEFAIADGQISTSTLQRRLKIGYARAGRLTDEMEERGIVSAKDGSKPRKCLITREEWEEIKRSTEG